MSGIALPVRLIVASRMGTVAANAAVRNRLTRRAFGDTSLREIS